jgi:hypothetical protein
MGGCVGSPRDGTSHSGESSDVSGTGNVIGTVGHNKPLKHRRPKWKSDVRLTEAQLQQKRDEFWDTAPAFEGRSEIWDALKASAQALDSGDHQLAQAILDGAGISLPNGTLMDCYDELGNRYQLPVYVLSAPINLLREGSETESVDEAASLTGPGVDVPIKLHLSTGQDLRLTVHSTDTIGSVKRQIQAVVTIDARRLRIFFAGKQLVDKQRIDDVKIHRGYTLQVVVADLPLHVVTSAVPAAVQTTAAICPVAVSEPQLPPPLVSTDCASETTL